MRILSSLKLLFSNSLVNALNKRILNISCYLLSLFGILLLNLYYSRKIILVLIRNFRTRYL